MVTVVAPPAWSFRVWALATFTFAVPFADTSTLVASAAFSTTFPCDIICVSFACAAVSSTSPVVSILTLFEVLVSVILTLSIVEMLKFSRP